MTNDISDGMIGIHNCARCGKSHAAEPALKLTKPVVIKGVKFTHWVVCPSLGEPVLMKVAKDTNTKRNTA